MSVFKPTQNQKNSVDTFKPTENRSYDSTLTYSWEAKNKAAYDTLEKYRRRISSGGYLSADDLAAYREALDRYVETSNKLRGITKAFGQGGSNEVEWRDTVSQMNSSYKDISDYFSKWKTEDDFRIAQVQAEADAKKMAELTNGYDPTKHQQEGMAGWEDFQAYLDQINNRPKAEPKKKSGWELFLEGIASIGSDTSIPGVGGSQVLEMSEEAQRKDAELGMPTERWTDEERNRFGYLWNTERQKAWNYAKAVNLAYEKQDEDAKIKEIQDAATANPFAGIGHTLGAIATAPLGMADYLNDLISYGAVGYVPQGDGEITPFEYSQAVTGGISQNLNDAGGTLNENIPIIGGKGWGDVYGLGTSIAQSSMAAATGGGAQALVTFFGSAAASGVDDALRRGANGEQAMLMGTSLGAAEALAEMLGIDNLMKIGSSAGKQLLWNLLKQAGAEGLEEGVTTFLGNVADQVFMGDKSNFYIRVQAYMSAGLSEDEAKNKAWSELWGDLAYDMLGGLVSGGVHAGPKMAYLNYKQNSYSKKTYGSSQNELVEEALEINPDNAFAKKMQGRLDGGKNLSGAQLSELVRQNNDTMTEQDAAKIQKAIESRLAELGETGDVSALAAALAKQAQNQIDHRKVRQEMNRLMAEGYSLADALEMAAPEVENLSRAEENLIANSQYGQRVANELNVDNIRSGNYSSQWAGDIGTNRIHADVYDNELMALAMDTAGVPAKAASTVSRTNLARQSEEIASPEGSLTTEKETATESHYEVSEDGQMVDTKTGNAINPQGLVKAKDGTYKIATKDSDPVATSDVSYADNNQALVYETFVNLEGRYGKINKVIANMDLDSRNALLGIFNPEINKDGDAFAKAAVSAFFYGHQGIPYEAIAKDPLMGNLTDQQRKLAWNQGKMAGMKATTAAQSNVDTVYAEAQKVLDQKGAKKGGYQAVLDEGISPMSLNKTQKMVYNLANEIAQGVQTTIHLYAGKNKAQGFYNHATDEIWLNLNAANTSREHIMAFTLAHELVHRAKKGSPAKYKAFTEFLMKEYGKQGADVDAMIREQLAAAEAFDKTVPDSKKINMTKEKALEEVVCDACQKMLLDTNAGQKLAEFGAQSKENKSFLEDLKRWITEILDKLRSYFKNAEPDSLAAKEFDKFDANVKQILADMYVDMSIDAGEKLSTIKAAYGGAFAEKFRGLKDIQYNLAAVETHKAKLEKEFSENSSSDLKTIMARYDKIINIWKKLGGELDSKFLAEWNSKIGKDRTFTIFKAQAGYKYNVELSSMCKKGVPLFEAIDTIVKKEVMKELDLAVLGKAEKEILYDILKQHNFEIPCAICYVEQARQREGVIIDAFLNGKVEKNNKGETTKTKLGWNQVLDSIQKEMKANGVNYSFAQVSRDIATEKYTPADLNMDMKTQAAFYVALKKIANKEIARYNKEEGKSRKLLADVTPETVKECFKGTIPANLKIFKVLFEEPSSRFKIQSDLLYSSIATQNLSMAHNKLYGLFNSQGGVSGYKTKQGTTIYWGDILGKSWKPDVLRNEGGVRNQSNSDFQMYTLLDQVQMYIDFTAKGYYLQAYTKVLSELKLFGLSRGKINASLIPKVVVYFNADGTVDVEKTMATAGLDENGNPIYDDIEGINHNEAFMLIEDPEYSKSICGICIGYSDAHILKLLDDNRVQQIIGFHDKTDDGSKRYKGARYAKNYNGLNEAVNKEGKTVHIGFNSYVKKAEKKFQFNAETETFEGTVNYNGKTYTADDIPRLAADLYLEMCAKKEYTPAYKDFAGHRNYYKLLADFGLYDSQGHYAPHRKVVFNMPDTVPYLDANGKKQTMKTYDYIKAELGKEIAVRDSISEALADTSSEGIIPQFKEAVKKLQEEKSYSLPKTDSDGNQLTAEQQEFFKYSVVRDANGKLMVMYHGTANGGAFTVFDGDQLDNSSLKSQIGQGFYFTNMKNEAESYMKNVDIYGRVSRGKNPNLHQVYLNITNPFDVNADTLDIDKVKAVYMDGTSDHFFNSFISHYLNNKTVNGKVLTKAEVQDMSKADRVSLYVDYMAQIGTKDLLSHMVMAFPYGKQSQLLASMKNRLGYDGIVEEFSPGQYQYVAFSSEQIKNVDNQNPTTDPDIRYSLPKGEPAPTFYSLMARVVDGVKQEKLGAASVVSMLRGKGVKAEEIKWSGIEEFLAGKKSVTKAELQEFIAGSMLQIEEEILDNKDRPYTEDQQKRLDEYEAKRDEVATQLADEWKKITGEDFPIRNAGAGLESAVTNAIIDANKEHKDAAFEGRLLKKLRKDIQAVIENNDDFGFDSWKDALRSIHRHRKDFINKSEMSSNDKAVIVKYCNALNAYNELPNKISDADTDRLRSLAREADPWNRKIMEVKHEHNEEEAKYMTNWGQYRLEGGKNYREMLFRIPGSTYTNEAMFTHWKERKGVLAHARVQDMDTFIGKMLFIEEIQSDWHNAGHKEGYRDPGLEDKHTLSKKMEKYTEEFYASTIADVVRERIAPIGYEGAGVSMILNFLMDSQESMESTLNTLSRKGASFTESEVSEIAKYAREYEEMYHKWETAPGDLTAPDAPFKDTYHEYVLKRLLREAAEQDYDSIGWTTAETQDERWQNNLPHEEGTGKSGFLVAYRNVYDRRMKKFLSDFGNKWGTTVGKTVLNNGTEVWSMAITDSMKDSVLYDGQVVYSLPKVEEIKPSEDQIEQNIREVADMKSVHTVDASKLSDSGKSIAEIYSEAFTSWGENIHSDVFGDIATKKSSIRSEFRHGSTAAKIASIEAIPSVIKSGKIVGWFEKNNGTLFRIVVAAPITIGKTPYIMGVMLQRDNLNQRLYLHDVVIEEEASDLSQDNLVSTGSSEKGENLFTTSILQKVLNVKRQNKLDSNDVDNKLPVGEDTSPRALLANAFEGIITNDIEKRKIQEYKGKVEMLNAEEQKLNGLRAQIKKLSFAKGKRDTKKIKDLQFDAIQTANRIATLDKVLLGLEASAPLQSILKREKEMAYKRAEQKGKEALEAYKKAERERDAKWQSEVKEKYQASKKKAIETREKREAREKLQKLVLDTVKWISYPTKTDVKCPDILKQPYADFLNGIDLSSKRLSEGGDPTKNDLRLSNAMSSLATALDKIMTSQDPAQETEKVLDIGYLDLPAGFVQKLRDMTENIKAMMVEGDYVVNNMSAAEVRQLSQMIRTLNHAIKTMSTLYANLRFANIEALGFDTMDFIDSLGEIEKTGGVKDFVEWDNALPYYAFKRFGKGGESVFEGLMDAQDKLAFLAQKIFDFREKAWTDKEAKAWSEDTHTIDLPNGNTLTLTTADAMSIYCLSRREQGLQHLLGGGTRVMGIQKGSQKAKDSRSLLTIKDIDAINSSLTDRQRAVAEAIQEFMSTVCSDWGNEVSMKRFLTKEFTEKFYFPIESNDENLPTKDPSAQQSDLFRLLNISATKPLTPGANNEVIIRNIFDVFTGHASDMARLNAYGMALLDYMKWLNYREKAVNEDGQIKVRGVRKSMEKAYGNAANRYVLNLVKDVNGRASDNGDPTILMKMMRNAKIASVGANLRVAALQFTSYPRAAMVLSTKSLALGLTKVPQITKAKKYCGIALWKSFGFYDTNISRSIEDQMKGVTNIRQKIIELSMKGAEWGDAITWGCLWNACEYEVASTKKYKVGSEEFNQEVGKKLREVVYATQVVDSTLTRSQIMRSKSGFTQEAAAFMSEPTLTANIIMDAGFQFEAEKRRTGSIKAAWNKTGKAVGRAVAVYGCVALLAALVESLGDAWRDDDDEEFYKKFLEELPENALLNMLPFNKVPIVSDVVELALSFFDIGFFSSEKMSTQWLSQIGTAVDAWGEVLSGKSTATVYGALYKTVKALSSTTGLPFGGAMREVVALWNNTAGAYNSAWKLRTYGQTQEDLRNELYKAIVSGNKKQEESILAEFRERADDEKDYQSTITSAIRKALRENDPRILEAAQTVIAGNAAERARIAREIEAEGYFALQDIQAAINAEIDKLRKEAKGK